MNLVLLGGPGAGKGTLAKQLKNECGFELIAPGELYRKEANEGTEFGLKARDEYWGHGNLCPNEMTNELIRRTVEKTSGSNLVFDGYPRTRNQAEFLDSIVNINLVLDLDVRDEIVVQRLLRRATIENRFDDTEEIIVQRLKVYHSNNADIINYYKQDEHRYRKIDGSGTPEDTFALVQQIIGDVR